MRRSFQFALLSASLVVPGCSKPEPPTAKKIEAPPAPTITVATFEPVYLAAKAVQGATNSGVTYIKFGELMQAFSTQLSIAKDHPLNEADKQLLPLFQTAFDDFQVSASLWKMKLDTTEKYWKGIPIELEGKVVENMVEAADRYNLSISEQKLPYIGKKYRSVPDDSPQRIWTVASGHLDQASKAFYQNRQTNSPQP